VHVSSGRIRVRWHKEGGMVLVEVSDDGVFRTTVQTAQLDRIGGRGILLMEALMDDVTIQRGTHRRPGTVVCMTKRTG